MSKPGRGGAASGRVRREHQPHDPAPLASTAWCPAPTPRPTSCSPSATPSAAPATACSSWCPTTREAPATGPGWSTWWSAPAPRPPTRWPRPATHPRRGAMPLASTVEDQAAGRRIIPQVSCRPTGMLFGLQSSLHPFSSHPTYRAVADLPLRRARGPARASLRCAPRCLAEEPATRNPIAARAHAAVGADVPARRPARLRAAPLEPAWPAWPSATVALPRRSSSTGCSSATVRRSCSRRSPATYDHDHEALREMMTQPEHRPRPLRRGRPLRAHLRREHAHLPAHPLGERPGAGASSRAWSRPSACRRRGRPPPTASPTEG